MIGETMSEGMSICPDCNKTYTDSDIESGKVTPCPDCYKCYKEDCSQYSCNCGEDMDLVEALESRFSLHDADQIYNLLSEFSEIDTDCGRISFDDFLTNKKQKGNK